MKWNGFRLALVANVLWGTSFLAAKYTLLAWPPVIATEIRFSLAIVMMLLLFPRLGLPIGLPRNKESLANICLVGLTGFGLLYPFQLYGLGHISSGLSSIVMLTSPLIVIILSRIFLAERLTWGKFSAIFIGMAGGTLLVLDSHSKSWEWDNFIETENAMGLLATLTASLSLASSVVITRKYKAVLNPQCVTFWSMVVGVVLLFPFAIVEANFDISILYLNISLSSGLAVLYLSMVCSVLCFYIWNLAISKTQVKELASSMHIKTPVAIILGIGFAGESFSLVVIFGTVLVSFAVWLSQAEKISWLGRGLKWSYLPQKNLIKSVLILLKARRT